MPRTATKRTPAGGRGKRGSYAKSAETRERILAAAAAVAGEVGLHAVSVARIAERARVAVGNLHYHFGSLDDLLRELMQHVADRLTGEILQAVEHSGDVFAREEAAFRAYLAYVRRHPTYVRLAEEARLYQPDIYHRVFATWLDLLGESIREGIASGTLRPLRDEEITAVTHYLIGARYFLDQMLQGMHGRLYPGDDAVVATYMQLLRGGLALDATHPTAARRRAGTENRA
jgi:AcrR family transcriptional regulator